MIIVKMNCIIVVLILFAVSCNFYGVSADGGVFQVQHKFAGVKRSLTDIKDHDSHRHQRLLFSIDVPLGGDGKATGTGLYFTKIKIGSPSRDYYVHVDTGSDLFWVNCVQCNGCPSKSGLGIDLTLYNPDSSSDSERITCDQEFCTLNSGGPIPGCYRGAQCQYQLGYGDGSSTLGYFVKDVVQYDRVSGNLATTSANSSIVIGCGTQQSGNLQDPRVALDGLIGFGQSKISMLSQIAATGAIKQKFAHCLDGVHGGGIFAIGNVVQPRVKTTPMVPNKQHYNVNLLSIMVGKSTLSLPSGVLGTANPKETIVDSGTTLAYLPDVMYQALISQILANHSDLVVETIEQHFQCFKHSSSVDDAFPVVTLIFENSLQLVVPPHDYLFTYGDAYCIGWQSSGTQSKDVTDMALLGDLVLTNKLVLYDIENQAIGWTNYDCSSSIGIQDDQTNAIYQVGAHHLSSAHSIEMGSIIILLLLSSICHTMFYSGSFS
ncbi:hypothetical protein ACHQM5_028306 [Ranunculus cassubicifolius]